MDVAEDKPEFPLVLKEQMVRTMTNPTEKSPDAVYRIWPEGESACIWMQAGLVAFKLCDRAFECENCPFDALMRRGTDKGHRHNEVPGPEAPAPAVRMKPSDDALCFDPEAWYGAGFWYVRRRDEHLVEIGLNEIGALFLPPVREVILPRLGTALTATQTSMWLIASEGTLGLTAPCAGVIRGVNPRLLDTLVIRSEPARQVRFMDPEVSSVRTACRGLLRGTKAAEYLQTQHKELMQILEDALDPLRKTLGPTSHDGGTRLPNLAAMLGGQRYFHLVAQFYRR